MQGADIHRIAVPGLATAGSPFSHVVVDGTYAFLSGIVASDVSGGAAAHGDIAREAEIVMAAIREALAQIKLGMERIVRVEVHLTDLSRIAEFDLVYRQFFPSGALPARTCTQSGGLAGGSNLEITVTARLSGRQGDALQCAAEPEDEMTGRPDIDAMFGATETDTFLGLPKAGNLATLDAKIAILGVPCATPYQSVGPYCTGAPRAIRDAIAGYANNLHHVDFDIGGPIFPGPITAVDGGDLACTAADPAANRTAIRDAVATVLAHGAAPIIIGGDDSVPIPVIEAFHDRGPLTIVQIDAHIDWREEVAGERWGLSSTMRRASEMPHVERIIQVGQRAIGSARPGDLADAKAWGVIFVPAQMVHEQGIAPVLDAVLAGSQVLVTLDCDGLDPPIMPGVLAPAPGGLTYWQAIGIVRGIAAKARIAALDIVEFVPERDVAGLGALTAARIIANVLGIVARQAAPVPD